MESVCFETGRRKSGLMRQQAPEGGRERADFEAPADGKFHA